MKQFKQLENFFDKMEDHVRHKLSHYPKFYALISGIATILSWVSIWGLTSNAFGLEGNNVRGMEWLWLSIIAIFGIGTLLITGAFINLFGDREVIEKTLKEEEEIMKKEEGIIEKEEMEVKEIDQEIREIKIELQKINAKLSKLN